GALHNLMATRMLGEEGQSELCYLIEGALIRVCESARIDDDEHVPTEPARRLRHCFHGGDVRGPPVGVTRSYGYRDDPVGGVVQLLRSSPQILLCHGGYVGVEY